MKSEIMLASIVAIIGVISAYLVCNLFVGDSDLVKVKKINGDISTEISVPDSEIFNYRALNPTVDIFIGTCTELDETGDCADYSYNTDVVEEDVNGFENEE